MDFHWQNGVPALFQHCTFGTFEDLDGTEEALGACMMYAEDFSEDTSGGLYIHGGHGAGKTHMAVAILHRIAGQGPTNMARFIDVYTLEQLLRCPPSDAFQGQIDVMRVCRNQRLLVIDGVNETTATEAIRSIIHERYNQCLPTIITSTLKPDELEKVFGAGVHSRLRDMCKSVEIKVTNFRKAG